MDDIFVARLMSSDLITVAPDTLVEDAGQTMLENGISSLVVVDDDGRLEGILTTTDFVTIVAESYPKAETTVERYMTTDVVTVSPQQPITEVANVMLENGVHHLPVVDQDEGVVGIVTTTDLAGYLTTMRASV
ncbi:CBS domain-containing protein [Natronosalvus halobius]|uniref:CBS domain-containing protein n=1 Tax=Natronosalvus halobius TaxID=2953746 RepID=UPI00209FBAB9|nr:CBS domain-containing protein [Natronosalvus halobius]USZ72123.1 CBS domain-containing protein [Natronosalvus halobius]